MDTEIVIGKVTQWVEQKFSREPEFFFVDARLHGRKLTVFIDGDQGITVDKCAEVSRYLQHHLDKENLLGDDYILEVSSPGIDNAFKTQRQYLKAIGREVAVVRYDGQKIIGTLAEVHDDKLLVTVHRKRKGHPEILQKTEIPVSDIKSTKINLNF
ncbi:MAG: hypothetical protein KatS3mg031_2306 [Chitinophagales bacterium]|nr:MAG: hypothetical protein KatS3mg031_2306 [Chitinophagales bacterium]